MTRSLSFKIHGASKEHSHAHPSRRGPQPKKLNTESWVKGRQATGTRHVKETPPDLSRLGCNIGDKKSLWAKKVDTHKEKQSLNPFSDSFDADKLRKMLTNKDDPNYGRPDSGSLSAMRAAAGEAKMRSDICDVCDVIFQHGQRTDDGLAAIQFGPLFSMYNRINDKLVGLLIRARKRDLVHFEGEMLYQNRDDDKWVVLSKSINTVHAYFGRSSDVPGGGEVEPGVRDNLVFRSNSTDSRCSSVETSRRNSKVSICSMPPNLGLGAKSPHLGTAMVVAGPDIQFDPGYADPDISVDTNTSEALDHFPSNDQNHLAGTAAANLDVKSSGSNAHPPSKMSAKGLRNSFRKLVKPLVKKRTTEVEEGDVEGGSEESLLSRMGSSRRGSKATTCLQGGSSKMQAASSCAALETGESSGGKGVEAKWKKVLGVSIAIGRMARMAGVSPEDPEERMKDEKMPRRGSTAL